MQLAAAALHCKCLACVPVCTNVLGNWAGWKLYVRYEMVCCRSMTVGSLMGCKAHWQYGPTCSLLLLCKASCWLCLALSPSRVAGCVQETQQPFTSVLRGTRGITCAGCCVVLDPATLHAAAILLHTMVAT
jgi:hypothetical protein